MKARAAPLGHHESSHAAEHPSAPQLVGPPTSPRALYVHVPFCPSVCPYCDFHKMLRNEPLVARYMERLEAEIAEVAHRYPGALDTIYLGGGTPSHLTDAELRRLFGALGRGWPAAPPEGGTPTLLANHEVTLEADPLTFDLERLRLFEDLGVTRLSLGLQSTQDEVLTYLGRLHDGAAGLGAVRMALASGMRVNVDIIMAVPGQRLEEDLRRVLDLGVSHLSVYSLTIEPGTPFGMRGVTIDPDADADAFELAGGVIAEYGLERYEVSNFARPGHESLHNLAYWRGHYYLAVGPGASAYLPGGRFGVRTKNPPIKTWLLRAAPESEALKADDVVLERLMTGLRTAEGVDLAELERRTGGDVARLAPAWLREALRHELLTLDERRLRATPKGLERLDALLRTFVRSRAYLDP